MVYEHVTLATGAATCGPHGSGTWPAARRSGISGAMLKSSGVSTRAGGRQAMRKTRVGWEGHLARDRWQLDPPKGLAGAWTAPGWRPMHPTPTQS
jgi:hypothetical protein